MRSAAEGARTARRTSLRPVEARGALRVASGTVRPSQELGRLLTAAEKHKISTPRGKMRLARHPQFSPPERTYEFEAGGEPVSPFCAGLDSTSATVKDAEQPRQPTSIAP